MKKLIIIALIIGFASACTKSSIQYEQPGEISLRPVTAMTTKAAIQGTTYPSDATFNVWAWWADVPENGTGTDEWLRAQTVTLPLTAGTDGNAWLPGKKYVYTIVFGDNEIRIAPTVTEWKDEPNVNIEVQ